MTTHQPRVAVVVLNWNGWRNTTECLQTLRAVTYPNFRVIVVDNGSGAEDLVQLRQWARWIELVENGENRGFAGGNNVGIRHALQDQHTDYVLVLNNDTTVEPDFLHEIVETALRKQVDMVSPTILHYADRRTTDRLGIVLSKALLGYDMKQWEGNEPFCPSGCCALYSRRLLTAIELGGEYFDEDFFAYAEDVDLGIRSVLLGYKTGLASQAIIYHKGSAATSVNSTFALYHGHRNTVWYLAKAVPAATLIRHGLWILVGQTATIITSIRRRRGLLIFRAKLAGVRGIGRMLRKRRLVLRSRQIDLKALESALDDRPFYLFVPRLLRHLTNLTRVPEKM
jgi:GT2 family glycosyltransferase